MSNLGNDGATRRILRRVYSLPRCRDERPSTILPEKIPCGAIDRRDPFASGEIRRRKPIEEEHAFVDGLNPSPPLLAEILPFPQRPRTVNTEK
jgi:hypothetical protein